ncbi:MAG: enoyl-CoA hydratase/isomerase family protein [Actinomycetota bacterium]
MTVVVSVDGPIAVITLSRPEVRNALSAEMCREITAALPDIEASDARVLSLKGEGPVFCAGADFAAISGPGGLDFLPSFTEMLGALWHFRLPTVACLTGAALGGGFQLATACDFRIASDDCKIGIPSSALGVVIDPENVERLVLLMGVRVAKEVLMTGRFFSGSEALSTGLVTEVHPAAEIAGAADAFVHRVASLSPMAVQGAKQTINAIAAEMSSLRSRDPEGATRLDASVAEAYRSDDLQEGVAAMREKRAPNFKGS